MYQVLAASDEADGEYYQLLISFFSHIREPNLILKKSVSIDLHFLSTHEYEKMDFEMPSVCLSVCLFVCMYVCAPR
jgi:hypothetical protein